jgi:electron transfer flavoprotein-quinone oxidoreductase
MVRKLLEGGEAKEYMAHLIPEGGWASVPPVYAGGFLVAGDAAMMVNGIFREGSNLAAISGKLAAQTALEALDRGDFSARGLSSYMDRLEDSFIVRDLQGYSRISHYAHHHPDLFTVYPQLLAEAIHGVMTVDSQPKYLKLLDVMRGVRERRPLLSMAKDLAGALRALP